MRYWPFGTFASQQDDINGMFMQNCKSILSFGNTSDVVSNPNNYNPVGLGFGALIGDDGAGTSGRQVALVEIAIGQIKAKLGQIPVLIKCELSLMSEVSDTLTSRIYRMYTSWDAADTNSRYKDVSALTTWYEDTYGPYPGQDRETTPSYQGPASEAVIAGERWEQNITSIVERALRDNTPIEMMLWPTANQVGRAIFWKEVITTRNPLLYFFYLYPIEFYEDSGGNIDYSSAIQEAEDGHYYIGAVERGQTGSATKGWIRNYSGATQHVELFDDHPEFANPVQREGTGTGLLDFVTLSDPAVSQLYTVVFYSSTQYEVKAEAYRDNAVNLHPQIDTDASWRGAVGSDFTAPSGGLTIPAAAWQPGTLLNDEFEFGVRGNTTDTTWPADSNDQVEITQDDGGVADAAEWRPITGRRESTTNTVAVDGASIFFPVRHLLTGEWPIGNRCFIQDADKIDEGTITAAQERLLDTTPAFTGTGDDDLTPSGNYNGNSNRTYRVQIDAEGSPDTFSWSRDGTTSWVATGVAISDGQLLEDGVYLNWGGLDNHTSGDYWLFDADTWGGTVGARTGGSNSYAAGATVATTLPIRSLSAAVFANVNADSGASESPASRLYLDDTTGFTQADVIFVQQVANQGIYESATIATGGVQSTYLDLTAVLTNDYSDGDFCTKQGAGEAAFWMRPVATVSTVEELKRLRVNARML